MHRQEHLGAEIEIIPEITNQELYKDVAAIVRKHGIIAVVRVDAGRKEMPAEEFEQSDIPIDESPQVSKPSKPIEQAEEPSGRTYIARDLLVRLGAESGQAESDINRVLNALGRAQTAGELDIEVYDLSREPEEQSEWLDIENLKKLGENRLGLLEIGYIGPAGAKVVVDLIKTIEGSE